MIGSERRFRRRWLAALLLLLGLVFLPGLDNHDLWAPDEPRYAQVSREMLQGGDWLLPHVNGRIYTDKPPGYFWCAALLSLPAGDVTPLTARLPSALAAVLLGLLTAAWGERRLGGGAGRRAAVALASCWLAFDLGRSAHLDMLLALLVAVAVLAAREQMQRPRQLLAALFWLAMAAAVLVKGPVGLLLPMLVVVVDRLAARAPADLLRLRPAWGLPLALAPPLAWILTTAALRPGYRPLAVLDRHVVSRFGEGLHHAQPFWYFGVHFFIELAPWAFLMPAAMVAGWRRQRFLVVWLLVILGFFTISSEKRGLYIMPMVPAAALLMGDLWRRLSAGESDLPRRLTYAGLALPALALCGLAALPLALARRGGAEAAALATPARVLAVAGGLGGGLLLAALLRRRPSAAMTALMASTLTVMLIYAHGVQPALDTFKSARAMGAAIARHSGPGSRIGMLTFRAAYVYYSGVRLEELGGDDETVRWMREPGGRRLLLLDEDDWRRLQPRLGPLRQVAADGVGHRRMVLLERDG